MNVFEDVHFSMSWSGKLNIYFILYRMSVTPCSSLFPLLYKKSRLGTLYFSFTRKYYIVVLGKGIYDLTVVHLCGRAVLTLIFGNSNLYHAVFEYCTHSKFVKDSLQRRLACRRECLCGHGTCTECAKVQGKWSQRQLSLFSYNIHWNWLPRNRFSIQRVQIVSFFQFHFFVESWK